MNFFQRQRDVRTLSRRLVVLFVLAVVAMVAVVDLITYFLLGLGGQTSAFTFDVLIALSAFLILAIGLTSLVRTRMLRRGGGGKVAQSLGGLFVPENTTDPRLRRLRNVVEEMAIASGVPVPEVYVLPDEHGINAFAAGFTPADAAVAVTHGALGAAQPRRVAGRRRARVQPRRERRHAVEHPADGSAVRHSRSRRGRPGPGVGPR